jgi:hypothetical protein
VRFVVFFLSEDGRNIGAIVFFNSKNSIGFYFSYFCAVIGFLSFQFLLMNVDYTK